MMPWWWFGPSITRAEIESEMLRMKEGGIGGFEIATVYPMAVDDPARGIRNYEYLSPEFLDRIGFAARKARELGLRMDVTLGSGWSFGGPHITPDLASTRLRSDRREITPDILRVARPVPYEHEQLIAAFIGRGAVREVDANSFVPLDLSGDGPIALPRGAGPRTLLFYFSSRTGQVIKRAALGAEGYVLDHYSRDAIDTHLREVGDKLVAAAGPGGIHAIFCDSLEVYDADWTSDMLDQFQKRRGYDLRPLLPFIEFGADERAQQVRRDVGRTLTELYEERFLRPIQDWSRKHNVLFRMQAYGQPPTALASHRSVDLIDGEGFEWRTLSRARWASSAAHVFGRAVTASETWTWVHSPAFVTCPTSPIGTLPLATPTATFDIVVRLNPSYVGTGADILNTATVTTTSVDSDSSNNTSAASSPTAAGPSADVVLAKSILESSVVPGGTFTYRVTVSNAGPSTATNIQVSDPLPGGVTFVSSPSGCTASSGTVTCGPVASLLPAAAPVTFDFVVRLDAGYTGTGSDLGNVATATSFTPDPNTANNSNAPVTPTVGSASADVSIVKTAVEPSVVPGQTFSYDIVVSNAGPSVAINSVVTNTLPAGLTFLSSSAGCTAAGQVVTCPPIASLAVGGSTTTTIVVRLDPAYTGNGSDLGNIASVASDTTDPVPANNTSTAAASPTILAASADVQIVKSVSAAAVLPGENFTYTLTVKNNGPSNAANIVATDTLPSQVTFVSSAELCTAAGQSVTCPTVATLGVGASTTFTFVVQLDPDYTGDGSDVLNSSLVDASTADPAMANNSSPAGAPPVGPGQADLAIVKDVSTTPVTPGDNYTYTLTVSNQGPSSAFGLSVADTLPTGVTFVSSPDGCTASGQDVSCSSPSALAPGASLSFTLIVQLDASYSGNGSDIPNTATVSSPTPDPVPANNTSNPATPVIGAASSDVAITKSVVESSVTPGGTVTYHLVVTNNGISTALGVEVTDALPA